jgi:hypothetical protein
MGNTFFAFTLLNIDRFVFLLTFVISTRTLKNSRDFYKLNMLLTFEWNTVSICHL